VTHGVILFLSTPWSPTTCRGRQIVGSQEEEMSSSTTTRGVVFIHSSPRALCPHIEWALGGLLGTPVNLEWVSQPVAAGTVRSEISWVGAPDLSAKIAVALRVFPNLRFEITEEPSPGFDGQRFVSTPSHGIWRSPMGAFGESFISEEKLRVAIVNATAQGASLVDAVDEVIGGPWDRELEPFRYAGEGIPVRWLHQVG
jgi:hypothetical protein